MTFAVPRPLLENAGLAFLGERVALAALISPKMAERMLRTRNPHGKSNADVLRRLATAASSLRPGARWQVDFPADMDEHEASLYEHPYHHLYHTVRPTSDRWWVSPHADNRLRAALAKRERYLATPRSASPPDFRWFEATLIPDDTLLAVARDDDFTHGVLQSRPFALWWRRFHSCRTPVRAVESFPFPWPPATTLSALTTAQEEHRHAVARAYGCPADDPGDDDLLAFMVNLNRQRPGKPRAQSE